MYFGLVEACQILETFSNIHMMGSAQGAGNQIACDICKHEQNYGAW